MVSSSRLLPPSCSSWDLLNAHVHSGGDELQTLRAELGSCALSSSSCRDEMAAGVQACFGSTQPNGGFLQDDGVLLMFSLF